MAIDFIFKVMVLGNPKIGKTSFVIGKEVENCSYLYSQGIVLENVDCILENGDMGRLTLWDLEAKRYYLNYYSRYVSGSLGCLLCFDVSNNQSFNDLSIWIRLIRTVNGKIPIILVGTKSDLKHDIEPNKIDKFIRKHELDGFYLVSKNNFTVRYTIIDHLAQKIHEYKSKDIAPNSYKIQNIAVIIDYVRKIFMKYEIHVDGEYYYPTQEEIEKSSKFIENFLVCPVCGALNHESYLKRIFYTKMEALKKLKDTMENILEKIDNDSYDQDFILGVPCCNCFGEIFNESAIGADLDYLL